MLFLYLFFMKNRVIRFSGLMTVLFVMTLQGCYLFSTIIEEHDVVYDTHRKSLTLNLENGNRRSHLRYVEKTFVKETSADQTVSLKVYDVLKMSVSGFNLEDRVFLIIDEVVFPLTINSKELEHTTSIDESREDVKTSDSTSVSVVTGYSTNNLNISRLNYSLSTEILSRIQEANSVFFRYYAGPEMSTIYIRYNDLKMLKKLLAN